MVMAKVMDDDHDEDDDGDDHDVISYNVLFSRCFFFFSFLFLRKMGKRKKRIPFPHPSN